MTTFEITSNNLPAPPVTVQAVVDQFLARRSDKTRQAYQSDLCDFARFLSVTTNQEALHRLVTVDHGNANALALSYKNSLIERGLSANTVNRRLATLRSAVKLANTLGLINWTLSVENEKTQGYRDTTGTGKQGFRALLNQAARCLDKKKAMRDTAILHLLYDLALRRGEIVSLDLSDFDADSGTLSVLGKGRSQKQIMTLPESTTVVLQQWIEFRGTADGPLFTNCDRAGKGADQQRRLTGRAIYHLVQYLGRKAGIKARPHGLRHSAITEALDLTNGDVRQVQRFSRHKNVQTLMVYDDNRQDFAGKVAKLVAGSVQTDNVA